MVDSQKQKKLCPCPVIDEGVSVNILLCADEQAKGKSKTNEQDVLNLKLAGYENLW